MKSILTLLFLILYTIPSLSQNKESNIDIQALLQIKKSTDSSSGNLNWDGTSYSSWEGVTWASFGDSLKVTILDLSDKKLTDTINVSAFSELTNLDLSGNDFTSIELTGSKKLEYLTIKNNTKIKDIDLENIKTIQYFHCDNNSSLQHVKGLTTLTKLVEFLLHNTPISTKIDLSKSDSLTRILVNNNKIPEIVFPNTISLYEINVKNNLIESFDFGSLNSNLNELNISQNKIKTLDLSHLQKLALFNCQENELPFTELAKINQLKNTSAWAIKKVFYYPQKPILENKTLYIDHSVNYQKETYVEIDGVKHYSNFTWKKNGYDIGSNDVINTSNIFQFKTPGNYHCEISNLAFPLAVEPLPATSLKTKVIKVRKPYTIVSWPKPPIMIEGQALGSSIANTTFTSVSGKFIYKSPDTILAIGYHQLPATFIPTDTLSYYPTDGIIPIIVKKESKINLWPSLQDITYKDTVKIGLLKGGTGASVAGKFVFDQQNFVPKTSGVHKIKLAFIPTDTSHISVKTILDINVKKAVPEIQKWPELSDIFYNDTLKQSKLQYSLNKTSGSFNFENPNHIPREVGSIKVNVNFTPSDTNYFISRKSLDLFIKKGSINIQTFPTIESITYGKKLKEVTIKGGKVTTKGKYKFENESLILPVGTHRKALVFVPDSIQFYNSDTINVDITVNKAKPIIIIWPTASTITDVQTLENSNLTGAVKQTEGEFKFDQPKEILKSGVHAVKVDFTPTDTSNYKSLEKNINIIVQSTEKQKQIISWNEQLPEMKVGERYTIRAVSNTSTKLKLSTDKPNLVSFDDLTIIAKNAGEVTITVNQEGNSEYKPAIPISKKLIIHDITLSNHSKQNKVNITPNPSQGDIYINNVKKGEKIQIYDLKGNLIFDKTVITTDKKLKINKLKKGIYLLIHNEKSTRFQII